MGRKIIKSEAKTPKPLDTIHTTIGKFYLRISMHKKDTLRSITLMNVCIVIGS